MSNNHTHWTLQKSFVPIHPDIYLPRHTKALMSAPQSHGVFFTPPLPMAVTTPSSHVPRLVSAIPTNAHRANIEHTIESTSKTTGNRAGLRQVTMAHEDRSQNSYNNSTENVAKSDRQSVSRLNATPSLVSRYGYSKQWEVVCRSNKEISTNIDNRNLGKKNKNVSHSRGKTKIRKETRTDPYEILLPKQRANTSTLHSASTSTSPSSTVTITRTRSSSANQLRRHRCSRCGQEGHNVRACPQTRWFKQRCGLCGLEGHNARSCQANKIQVESQAQKPKTLKGYLDDRNASFDPSDLSTVGSSLQADEERIMANVVRSRVSQQYTGVKPHADKEELIGGIKS